MALDSSIIFDTDPSYINRIPYSIIESKQHSTYIKKFINEKKIIIIAGATATGCWLLLGFR